MLTGAKLARAGRLQSVQAIPQIDRASWNKEAGELRVRVGAGRYLQAGELLRFTFALENPNEVRGNSALYVQATGPSCLYQGGLCLSDSIADRPVTIPRTLLTNENIDTKTLRAEANTFLIKRIGQAHEDPEKSNTLYITLMANREIKCPDSSCTSKAKLTLFGLACIYNKVLSSCPHVVHSHCFPPPRDLIQDAHRGLQDMY